MDEERERMMGGCSMLEVEEKFDVAADTAAPDLTGLPGVATADPAVEVELEATYFDTPAFALLADGITVRRRLGGVDAGWHLKLPADHGRYELREPLADGVGVPERFRFILRGVARGADLVEVATIDTRRRSTRLRDAEGIAVAEFCDDRVTALRYPSAGPATNWREWELELADEDALLAGEGAQLLLQAGATRSSRRAKLERALDRSTPHSSPVTEASTAGKGRAKDVLGGFLGAQAERLRHLDPLMRAGLPDAIHQGRVASRRIRAVLASFDRDFRGAGARHMRRELGWLINSLGQERDLEVLRARVDGMVPASEGPGAPDDGWIDRDLQEQADAAHDRVLQTLACERYFALLDALDDPGSWLAWKGRAKRPAGRELRGALRHEWRRLVDAAAEAGGSRGAEHEEALHAVRKSAKRLRYAAEAASPVFGERAVQLTEAMRALQDVLGRHHDTVVTGQALAALARQHPGTGHTTAVRGLLRQLHSEEREDEETYHDLEPCIEHSDAARWLS